MKFAFSDKFAKASSFIDLCNFTKRYGFDGIEISDVEAEKNSHTDSIFRASMTGDAKRKLVNRHIEIPVITYQKQVDCSSDTEVLNKYVDYASLANVSGIVIKIGNISNEEFKKIILPVIENADKNNVYLLIETVEKYAK